LLTRIARFLSRHYPHSWMGPAQASRLISHGLPLEGYSEGWEVHLAQKISSWCKLRHDRHRSLFRYASPSPTTVPFFLLSFGTLCAIIKPLWPRRRAARMGISGFCGS
jgi:hypothetical protein